VKKSTIRFFDFEVFPITSFITSNQIQIESCGRDEEKFQWCTAIYFVSKPPTSGLDLAILNLDI
jgi:hypothetical protein